MSTVIHLASGERIRVADSYEDTKTKLVNHGLRGIVDFKPLPGGAISGAASPPPVVGISSTQVVWLEP